MVDCDIHPMCRDQGCIADPNHCQRALDVRALQVGNATAAAQARMRLFDDNSPTMGNDRLQTQVAVDDDELFGEWSREYDAKNTERAAIVIAEMGARHRSGVIEL